MSLGHAKDTEEPIQRCFFFLGTVQLCSTCNVHAELKRRIVFRVRRLKTKIYIHIYNISFSLFITMTFFSGSQEDCDKLMLFFIDVFGKPAVDFRNFLLCYSSQRSARSQVPSQVATHQEIGSQLRAGERPDSNPGLQDNSSGTLPLSHHTSHIEPPSLSH